MDFSSVHDWALEFIKHKDLFERKIAKIEDSGGGVRVTRKDGSVIEWIANDSFFYPGPARAHPASRMVACRNTKENVKAIVKQWKDLVKDPALTIWCVNLETGEKWSVTPRVHDMITEAASLEPGLLSLMDTANGLAKDEPRRKKKSSMFEESSEGEEGAEEET